MGTGVAQSDRIFEADGTTLSTLPSGALWADVNLASLKEQGHLVEDILFIDGLATLLANEWTVDEDDATADVSQLVERFGGVRLQLDTTDNIEGWIQRGGVQAPYSISDTPADATELRWEGLFRLSNITDDAGAIALGLADLLTAGANVMQVDDSGILTLTRDFVGFRSVHTNGGATENATLDFVYQKTSTTLQVVQAAALTMVAGDLFKVGFAYKPENKASQRIIGYVNGAPLAGVVTEANIAAATFPDGILMNMVMAAKLGDAATVNLECKWMRIMQLRKQ